MKFNDLYINEELIKALESKNIDSPTDIQKKAIPEILDGKSVIALSETGTGKTFAYLLPLFQKIDFSVINNQVIILAPTHELAIQIQKQALFLTEKSGIPVKTMLAIGGVNIDRQKEKLKKKPQIIVGSPGRILELVKAKKIKTHTVKSIVVDEADILLTTESHSIIKAIIDSTMRDRQLLFFSASFSKNALIEIKKLSDDVIKVTSGDENSTGNVNSGNVNSDIEHIYFTTGDPRDKFKLLRKVIHALDVERAIIFINKNEDAMEIASRLKHHNIDAIDIHGLNRKQERELAFKSFNSGKTKFLIASDIAARGLDIKKVSHIINYDIPKTGREYLHRVGRTGRAGEHGTAVSIISRTDKKFINKIQAELKIDITLKNLKEGEVIESENKK